MFNCIVVVVASAVFVVGGSGRGGGVVCVWVCVYGCVSIKAKEYWDVQYEKLNRLNNSNYDFFLLYTNTVYVSSDPY